MKFESLNIIEPILRALAVKRYVTPTPIQEKTIPLLLSGKDVIGIAQTGTGKTAAFVVPILQKLFERYGVSRATIPKVLVLAPTRELVAQISESFSDYGKFLNFKHLAIYGGIGMGPQIRTLSHGVDILIATPGRLMDLMNQGRVNLRSVEFFVLDEADRMLDMGFLNDVKKIASSLSASRQSLFFSATMSKAISDLTIDFLKNPVRVDIESKSVAVDKIEQCVFFIDSKNKIELLLDLINGNASKDIPPAQMASAVADKVGNMNKVLVFVGMKYRADKVVRALEQAGVRAEAIHGNKSQYQRDRALNNFKSGKARVLVATDIAARGIDIKNIGHVINFDLPNEPENYIHRIGRTARAGKDGTAYSFCAAEDRNFLHQIEKLIKRKIEHVEHKYHSLAAKNASGNDAKPRPRNGRGGRSSEVGGRSRGASRGGRGSMVDGRGRGRGRSARGDSSRGRGRSRSGASAGRNRSRR